MRSGAAITPDRKGWCGMCLLSLLFGKPKKSKVDDKDRTMEWEEEMISILEEEEGD